MARPGGQILDPFAGSGTTLVAAELEGYGSTGIELSDHYHNIAQARLDEIRQPDLSTAS
ncbi:DNA methyltransferase [uncultured Kushneria sp.]|uniref:DNA methyltransferase n=1 Tax=uncultured Kushneria sp. TaxID=905033 RepID=UPI003458740E